MNLQDVHLLFRFNRWANSVMMYAANFLRDDQFVQGLNSSYSSVRDTMVHMMSCEWVWLRRWKGESPKVIFNAADFPALNEVRKRWAQLDMERRAFAADLTEDDLSKPITYVNMRSEVWTYKLGHMIQHIVNHSSYHRGQVMAMLRQLGVNAAPNDFLNFMDIVQAGEQSSSGPSELF